MLPGAGAGGSHRAAGAEPRWGQSPGLSPLLNLPFPLPEQRLWVSRTQAWMVQVVPSPRHLTNALKPALSNPDFWQVEQQWQ